MDAGGPVGRLLSFFQKQGVSRAIMAGQIAPKNLFDLRPDLKALLLLGKLRERNAESLFGAVADELARAGVTLLPATTYLEDHLAAAGHLAGPVPGKRVRLDVEFAPADGPVDQRAGHRPSPSLVRHGNGAGGGSL